MSLTERITAAFAKKSATAREVYIKALRSGDDAKIIPAADAAGIPAEQIHAHAAILDRAAELTPLVEQLPAAEKALADAQQQLAAAEARLEKARKPLEQAADEAGFAVGQAGATVRSLRPAINELRGLYQDHPHLLPADQAPACLREQWKSDGQQQNVDRIKRNALGAFKKASDAVANARLQRQQIAMGRLPQNCILSDPDNFGRDPELRSKAQAVVEKCEAELTAARAAAIKAGYSAIELDSIIYQLPA